MEAKRILFVCLGNICRSPSAEIILRHKLREAGLSDRAIVDSCGTAAYHVGCQPDTRMLAALKSAGYEYDGHLGRRFTSRDFADFDLIIPQDNYNRQDVLRCASSKADRVKVVPMRYWFSSEYAARYNGVPDPYYGGDHGFSEVIDIIAKACDRIIAEYILKED